MASDRTDTHTELTPPGLPKGSGYPCAVIEGGNSCANQSTALIHIGSDMLIPVCDKHEPRIDLSTAHIEWEGSGTRH